MPSRRPARPSRELEHDPVSHPARSKKPQPAVGQPRTGRRDRQAARAAVRSGVGRRKHHAIDRSSGIDVVHRPDREPRALAGFVIGHIAADEAEILSIGVAPEWQRRGIGRQMVEGLVRAARRAEVKRLFLEVAADNEAAAALYKSLGFKKTGARKATTSAPAARTSTRSSSASNYRSTTSPGQRRCGGRHRPLSYKAALVESGAIAAACPILQIPVRAASSSCAPSRDCA